MLNILDDSAWKDWVGKQDNPESFIQVKKD